MSLGFLDLVLLFFVTNGATKALVVLAAMTSGKPAEVKREIATRATVTAAIIMAVFAVFGQVILHVFHITLPALMIAGGVILFVFALGMVLGGGDHGDADGAEGDISIYPIAIPLLATPQGIVAVVAVMATTQTLLDKVTVIAALALVLLGNFVVLRNVDAVLRRVRPAIIAVVGRVVAVLLAALAVQLVIYGLVGLKLLDRSVLPTG